MSATTETLPPPPVNATALTVVPPPKPPPIAMTKAGVSLSSLEEVFRFSKAVSVSGFAPKGLEKEESIMVAIQLGMELGLTPMAALQNIAVINGRPGIYGDAALALVRSSGLLEVFSEHYEVAGKKLVTSDGDPRNPTTAELKDETCSAVCRYKRRGEDSVQASLFSVGDAKLATLLGKAGPWTQYPARMLKFRARGFGLRDGFGDVLKGLRTTEELHDIPREIDVTPAKTAAPSPSSGILGAADAIPVSTAVASSSASPEIAAAERQEVIAKLAAALAEHGVSEEKLFGYAQRAKLVTGTAEYLFDLPTDVLAKLIFAVPSQKGGAAK